MTITLQGLDKVAAKYEPDIGTECWIPMRRHLIGKLGNAFASANAPRCDQAVKPRGVYVTTVDGTKTYKRLVHVGVKASYNAIQLGTTNVDIDGKTWKVVSSHGENHRGGALPRS